MFAGHDQSGGEVVEENGKKFKLFYGMSSATAMDVSNIICVFDNFEIISTEIQGAGYNTETRCGYNTETGCGYNTKFSKNFKFKFSKRSFLRK